jgi:hypothetical protein
MENGLIKVEENSLAAYAVGLEQKLRVCELLLKSGCLPNSIKSPQAVYAVVMMGQEMGFSPMRSLELIDFIQGRACLRVAGMMAKAVQAGGKFSTVEETDKLCTIKAERKDNGWTETYTFTIQDAAAMKLTGKDNWIKMPKFMLYARCASVLCRRGWPDVLGGLYSSEEMRDSVEPHRAETVEVLDLKTADQLQADAVKQVFKDDDVPNFEEKKKPAGAGIYTYNLHDYLNNLDPAKYKAVLKKIEKLQGQEIEPGIYEIPSYQEGLAAYIVDDQTEAA